MKVGIPRIMIASAMSGGGKTTVSCAIMRGLKNRGMSVAPFKCGPDYIDPLYHKVACGEYSVNLDLFFQPENDINEVFAQNIKNKDIAVIEGVMGYYDGMSMDSSMASSCEISKTLNAPTVVVFPAKGMAYTAIALIKGLLNENDNNIRGIILNQVTRMTYWQLKKIIEGETKIRVVGYVPKLESVLEHRHLGLHIPNECDTEKVIANFTEVMDRTIDFDVLLEIANEVQSFNVRTNEIREKTKVTIAVARDEAFCFCYKDNLDILRHYGAEIKFFSPLMDSKIPPCDAVIFGGGYPELYADKLSENKKMLKDVKEKILCGMPCLAECGGFMYLGKSITDREDTVYNMVGILDGEAHNCGKLVRFGYINVSGTNKWLNKDETIKAHEFHYWDSTDNGSDCVAVKPTGRTWNCIYAKDNIFAGYPHLYYRSNIKFIKRFINMAKIYREG